MKKGSGVVHREVSVDTYYRHLQTLDDTWLPRVSICLSIDLSIHIIYLYSNISLYIYIYVYICE